MTVTVMRGQLEESRHRLHVAVADRAGRLVAWHGDPARPTTMRSCAKPFQAQPMVESGALEAFGIDDETLAVCCASHEGLDMHADAVRRGLEACGLTPEVLRNSTGTADERLRHNCSGNHLAFLALSAHRGWDIPTYRDPGHPAQGAALAVIAEAAGVPLGAIATCSDGCGVVAFELPLQTIAAMYARLDELVPRQYAAMRAHPLMVAGPGDFDSELPPAVAGAVGKGGAEALGCIALPEQGLGIALRVEDGGYRAVDPGLMAVLEQLLEWDEPPAALAGFREPPYRNSPGDVVGFLRAEVPLARA
jgi:L-asparaginase II